MCMRRLLGRFGRLPLPLLLLLLHHRQLHQPPPATTESKTDSHLPTSHFQPKIGGESELKFSNIVAKNAIFHLKENYFEEMRDIEFFPQ